MNVRGALEAAVSWLGGRFGPDQNVFSRLEMISAFSEGAQWAEQQHAERP